MLRVWALTATSVVVTAHGTAIGVDAASSKGEPEPPSSLCGDGTKSVTRVQLEFSVLYALFITGILLLGLFLKRAFLEEARTPSSGVGFALRPASDANIDTQVARESFAGPGDHGAGGDNTDAAYMALPDESGGPGPTHRTTKKQSKGPLWRRLLVRFSGVVGVDGRLLAFRHYVMVRHSVLGLWTDSYGHCTYTLIKKRDPRDTPQSIRKGCLVIGLAASACLAMVFSGLKVCHHGGADLHDVDSVAWGSVVLVALLSHPTGYAFSQLGKTLAAMGSGSKKAFWALSIVLPLFGIYQTAAFANRTAAAANTVIVTALSSKIADWCGVSFAYSALWFFVGRACVRESDKVPRKMLQRKGPKPPPPATSAGASRAAGFVPPTAPDAAGATPPAARMAHAAPSAVAGAPPPSRSQAGGGSAGAGVGFSTPTYTPQLAYRGLRVTVVEGVGVPPVAGAAVHITIGGQSMQGPRATPRAGEHPHAPTTAPYWGTGAAEFAFTARDLPDAQIHFRVAGVPAGASVGTDVQVAAGGAMVKSCVNTAGKPTEADVPLTNRATGATEGHLRVQFQLH